MQDTTTPAADDSAEPLTGHYGYAQDADGKPLTINITVTQQDPELQAIEATLALLHMLTYDTRVRALAYLRDRIESDPAVWGTRGPTADQVPATHADIAQVLAESDGRGWDAMSPSERSPYFRRAQALSSIGFAVMRAS